MVRRFETDPLDHDERLGEAIESYLALAEKGPPPEPEVFAERYPDLSADLLEALEGLALVRGLVGDATGGGVGHRLETGRRIAGYRIVRELGRGGMGVVYEAVHVGLDRPVALKVLGANAAPDSSGRRRFLNEARTAAGLHHTHIVPVFDVGQVGGLCYYAMQRIEGSGLDRVIRHLRKDRATAAGSSYGSVTPGKYQNKGQVPPAPARPSLADETASWGGRSEGEPAIGPDRDDEPPPFEPPCGSAYYRWVAEVGSQAAEALGHAHQRGIIHRDIKPSNLLVDARGLVWVADFGLARRLADPGLTQHDSLLGTPRYMSPEQARIGPIDGRTDVYSLGATLYELLTLRPPFEGQTAAELVDQIDHREPVPPRRFDPRVPRDLETILLKALAKRPADRYATALDLADDLTRFLNLEPVRARRISPVGRLWRLVRRHPGISAVSTAAAVTVLTVATVAYVKVVHESNDKGQALEQLKDEMRRTEAANHNTQTAMGRALFSSATVVRLSNVPNRRAESLKMLKQAASLRPEPALRAELRNEAVESLALRDVEARPSFSTGPTRGIVFTPEGNRLASLSVSENREELTIWNGETRRRLGRHVLRAEKADPPVFAPGPGGRNGGPRRSVWQWQQPVLTAAGSCLVVIRTDGQSLRLFDTTTDAVHDLDAPGRQVIGLFAARDGRRLVTIETSPPSDRDRDRPGGPPPTPEFRVNLWNPGLDVESGRLGKPIATLTQPKFERGEQPLIAIAPDGTTVATARTRQTAVALWSAEDGHSLGQVDAPSELAALTLGPDGLLATASGGAVQLWDLDTKTLQASLTLNQSLVRHLRFNPHGTLLAVAGMGHGIELWDVAARNLVAVLPTPDRVNDLTFSPDGRTLAASSGSTTSVWAVVDPVARVRLSGFDSPLTALAFRTDGLLAIGTARGALRFWQPDHCPSNLQPAGNAPEASADASRPGRNWSLALAFDDRDRLLTVDFSQLQCWGQAPKLTEEAQVSLNVGRGDGGMFPPFGSPPIARTRDGATLFLSRSGRVLVWHSDHPDKVHSLELPPRKELSGNDSDHGRRNRGIAWRALAASPTGDRLYLIDQDSEVHALALDGRRAHRIGWKLPGGATGLALSPDGMTLAISDNQGRIALVETVRGSVRARLRPASPVAEGSFRILLPLAFAPEGRTLAVGTPQGTIELWSLDDLSEPLLRLTGHHASQVSTLVFDLKGEHLASGGADQIVEVWDLTRTRTELNRLGLGW